MSGRRRRPSLWLAVGVALVVTGCTGAGLGGSPSPDSASPGASPTGTPAQTAPPSPTATPSPTDSPTPSPTSSPTPEPVELTSILDYLVDHGVLDQATAEAYASQYVEDALGDHSHGSGQEPGFKPDWNDLVSYGGFMVELDADQAAALSEALPCGMQDRGFGVVCPMPAIGLLASIGSADWIAGQLDPQPFAAGSYAFVKAVYDGVMPIVETTPIPMAIYFTVSDPPSGRPWEPEPAFPEDSYQGTSRWFEIYVRGTSLQMVVTEVPPSGPPIRGNTTSNARALVLTNDHTEIGFYIPFDEFGPNYRVGAIGLENALDFAPATTSHDYSGDLDSLLPLIPCGGTCTTTGP